MDIFEELESNVRGYCRSFPKVFDKAEGAYIFTETGEKYLDFFAGAGALNYGHNNAFIKDKVVQYLLDGGVLHALDMYTVAKRQFLTTLKEMILAPKDFSYKVQFCGPTGTNGVEAALKIARKVTGRRNILAFKGGFHGMTIGALSVTSNKTNRCAAGIPLEYVDFLSFPTDEAEDEQCCRELEKVFQGRHGTITKPAAVILETVQAEGGVNIAPVHWLQEIRRLCTEYHVVMICDDIQVGCFRTGSFFSFERAGIIPDLVTLSKSISGIGIPMSIVLIKPEFDVWKPGEHTGTFRGHQVAFVAATAALHYAHEHNMAATVIERGEMVRKKLQEGFLSLNGRVTVRGLGMIVGVDFSDLDSSLARKISADCFSRGLIIETAGRDDGVLKLLPPLTCSKDELLEGCEIILSCAEKVLPAMS